MVDCTMKYSIHNAYSNWPQTHISEFDWDAKNLRLYKHVDMLSTDLRKWLARPNQYIEWLARPIQYKYGKTNPSYDWKHILVLGEYVYLEFYYSQIDQKWKVCEGNVLSRAEDMGLDVEAIRKITLDIIDHEKLIGN